MSRSDPATSRPQRGMKEREAYRSVFSPHRFESTLVFQWLTCFLTLSFLWTPLCCCIKMERELALLPQGRQKGKTLQLPNSASKQNQDRSLDSEGQSHRSALSSPSPTSTHCMLSKPFLASAAVSGLRPSPQHMLFCLLSPVPAWLITKGLHRSHLEGNLHADSPGENSSGSQRVRPLALVQSWYHYPTEPLHPFMRQGHKMKFHPYREQFSQFHTPPKNKNWVSSTGEGKQGEEGETQTATYKGGPNSHPSRQQVCASPDNTRGEINPLLQELSFKGGRKTTNPLKKKNKKINEGWCLIEQRNCQWDQGRDPRKLVTWI